MTKGTVAWLVPAPLRGSGGHRTIFQNMAALAAAGFECHAFLEPPPHGAEYHSAETGAALVERWFGKVPATFHLGFELDGDYDIAFATAWYTAEPLKRATRARHKAYFIQDYEAYFMPMSDGFILAENSFRYQFHGVSIGRWLSHELGQEFGMDCSYFDFCADLKVYRPLPEVKRERAVCFVYQPDKPRRCSLVGGQALTIVKQQLPDVTIYFYGNDQRAQVPFEFEHLGLISIERCNELYNRSAVGLCISSTNPSRVPFEMMAAGLPVVDIHGDNNLYDMPSDAVLLAEPTPESIAHAILQILRDPAEGQARSEAGLAFMQGRDLHVGFERFVHFTEALLVDQTRGEPHAHERSYSRPPVVAPAERALEYQQALVPPPPAEAPPPPPSVAGAAPSAPANGVYSRLPRLPIPSLIRRTHGRLKHTLRVLLTGR